VEILVNNKRINYVKEGFGDQVVLLVHGWGGSIDSLKELRQMLAKDYTVYALDLPGFGGSDPPDSDWGIDEYGEILKSFVSSLNLYDLNCIGHSFGGALGIYLAANHKGLIQKLVLLSPAYKRDPKKQLILSNKIPFYSRIKRYIRPIRKIVYRVFVPTSQALDFPQLEHNFIKIIEQDQSHLLSEIKQETLILWGDEDQSTPIENAYLLDESLEKSRLKVYENEGHRLPIIHPEKVYTEILRFLKGENGTH
jgi:pimeloyl-ACP methyl ester carboxylesterase